MQWFVEWSTDIFSSMKVTNGDDDEIETNI